MVVAMDPGLAKEAYSDYGSDLDSDGEALINNLLSTITDDPSKEIVLESIEDDFGSSPGADLVVPKAEGVESEDMLQMYMRQRALRSPSVEIEYEEGSRLSWNIAKENGGANDTRTDGAPAVADGRSPLERFRTKPKKPLSVTDLVSPAWCEIQYLYNLAKFGRKLATPAMKQGSAVHKVLEEQVHETVQVRVATKEDAFGLKIWNVIQGLRTLRATGMTRELEIWGVIDGQVVNGIIDEVSYTCPDAQFEASLQPSRKDQDDAVSESQLSITEFFKRGNASEYNTQPRLDDSSPKRRVYVTDVKTRSSKYVPKGASLRPTLMQLMLYRMLLQALASNDVPADTIFARYNLKPLQSFSDAFVAEVSQLDFNFREETPGDDTVPFNSSQASLSELASHNNLSAIWSLMIAEFTRAMTFPSPLSDVLKAEFRYSRTGEIIGSELFAYDESALQQYVVDEMKWWRGDRGARGVDIEEAFKCRICEFAEECTWRREKIQEATEKHRLRAASRAKSAV